MAGFLGCDVLNGDLALWFVVCSLAPGWPVQFLAFAPCAHWRQSEQLSSRSCTGADVISVALLCVHLTAVCARLIAEPLLRDDCLLFAVYTFLGELPFPVQLCSCKSGIGFGHGRPRGLAGIPRTNQVNKVGRPEVSYNLSGLFAAARAPRKAVALRSSKLNDAAASLYISPR